MKERLIESLKSIPHGTNTFGDVTDNLYIENVMAKHLIEDGWFRLPCKVGQKIYCIVEDFDEVMEGHVRQFIVAEGIFIDCVIRGYFNQVFHSSKIGKTVFLTREEAERALRKDEGK